MAEEATKPRLRLGMTPEGDQVLMIGSESETMNDFTVDMLIANLNTGKDDSKTIRAAWKKIKAIQKQYNSVGKPIDNGNLKTIPEGAPTPEGVIDDEAA
jgi:hypothetical protein